MGSHVTEVLLGDDMAVVDGNKRVCLTACQPVGNGDLLCVLVRSPPQDSCVGEFLGLDHPAWQSPEARLVWKDGGRLEDPVFMEMRIADGVRISMPVVDCNAFVLRW